MQDFREFRKRPFHSHLGWKKGCKSEWPFGYQCLPGFREHAAAVGYLPFTVLKSGGELFEFNSRWAAVGYLPFTVLKLVIILSISFLSALQSGTYRLRYWNRYKRFINRNIKRLQSGTYRLRYWNELSTTQFTISDSCSRVLTVYGIETKV